MKKALSIFEQVAPEPNDGNRFRIIEMTLTVDGPRSRITNHSFPTLERARKFIEGHEDD